MDNKTDSDADDNFNGCTEGDDTIIKTSTNYLKQYAATKGHSLHSISQMPPEQLADYLKDFYTQLKTKDDQSGKSVSMRYVRAGLHKYFEKNHDIDILKDKCFDYANAVFDVASRQTPRRCHRLRIEFDDLKKIYLGKAMNLNHPETLQNKIFFDVNLYICNRGKDFLRVMCKSDFVLDTDKDGRRYVWLKYHPKFSFNELVGGVGDIDLQMGGTQIGQRMYERIGDERCPVASFLHYLTHLHPMTEAFWQRPKRSFVASDYVWYDNTPLGNSTLSKILTRTCHSSGLYENYTNHAIKNSYIQVIENICKLASNANQNKANPQDAHGHFSQSTSDQRHVKKEWDESQEAGTDTREAGDNNQSVGIQQAKMKVLEMVHGLEVKDIKAFVDWLKTFRVEMDGGGLVVMCSPVDQSGASNVPVKDNDKPESRPSKEPVGSHSTKVANGNNAREHSPCPSTFPSATASLSSAKLSKSSSQDEEVGDFGIAIRQLEFESVSTAHCSMSDLTPMKVMVPCQNTVLLTGLQDSVQLLIHNREGPPLMSEPMHSRIFYSQHEMDVAVVTALLSARNSLKSGSTDKMHNVVKMQDKYKPVKKRSLVDMCSPVDGPPNKQRSLVGNSSSEYDTPSNKQHIVTTDNKFKVAMSTPPSVVNISGIPYMTASSSSSSVLHKSFPHYSPLPDGKAVSLLPKVQLKSPSPSRHHPSILPVRSLKVQDVKIKSEPMD